MSWALKGLTPPLKDKIVPLKEGLTLGRKGDLEIPDTKASSIHARIAQGASGGWLIEDNNSKNGVRAEGGEKVDQLELTEGVKFYIGDHGFEVVRLAGAEEETLPAIELAKPPAMGDEPPPIVMTPALEPLAPSPPAKKERRWQDILASFLDNNAESFTENLKPVTPLAPAVVLDFVRGVQATSRWVIGYGPRKVGASALDLPIWEPGAPAVCFELVPSSEGIVFKTAHASMVTLNGQSVDKQVLRVGDSIRILETTIEVDFIE